MARLLEFLRAIGILAAGCATSASQTTIRTAVDIDVVLGQLDLAPSQATINTLTIDGTPATLSLGDARVTAMAG